MDKLSPVTPDPVDSFVEAIQISMLVTGAFAILVSVFFEASTASVGASVIFTSIGLGISCIRKRIVRKLKP